MPLSQVMLGIDQMDAGKCAMQTDEYPSWYVKCVVWEAGIGMLLSSCCAVLARQTESQVADALTFRDNSPQRTTAATEAGCRCDRIGFPDRMLVAQGVSRSCCCTALWCSAVVWMVRLSFLCFGCSAKRLGRPEWGKSNSGQHHS